MRGVADEDDFAARARPVQCGVSVSKGPDKVVFAEAEQFRQGGIPGRPIVGDVGAFHKSWGAAAVVRSVVHHAKLQRVGELAVRVEQTRNDDAVGSPPVVQHVEVRGDQLVADQEAVGDGGHVAVRGAVELVLVSRPRLLDGGLEPWCSELSKLMQETICRTYHQHPRSSQTPVLYHR